MVSTSTPVTTPKKYKIIRIGRTKVLSISLNTPNVCIIYHQSPKDCDNGGGNRQSLSKVPYGEILELIIGVMISFFPPKTGLIITVTLGNSYNYIAYCWLIVIVFFYSCFRVRSNGDDCQVTLHTFVAILIYLNYIYPDR